MNEVWWPRAPPSTARGRTRLNGVFPSSSLQFRPRVHQRSPESPGGPIFPKTAKRMPSFVWPILALLGPRPKTVRGPSFHQSKPPKTPSKRPPRTFALSGGGVQVLKAFCSLFVTGRFFSSASHSGQDGTHHSFTFTTFLPTSTPASMISN